MIKWQNAKFISQSARPGERGERSEKITPNALPSVQVWQAQNLAKPKTAELDKLPNLAKCQIK